MSTHLTLRMAWHDNKWDGSICQDPERNAYCVGSRSLLSERIARKRKLEMEIPNSGREIDDSFPDYLPPCYWSSAAFSVKKHNIIHQHPFIQYEDTKTITETLDGYSMFSWPFRLSFNHSRKKKKAQGNYPRDLEERISHFISKFEPKNSIVFFYLNYDNPVSGDDEKYALVGCGVLNKTLQIPPDFNFSRDERESQQKRPGMKYFPVMNWAIQISYDFDRNGIRLPYHEYREYIQKHREESGKLDEIRVLIEEDSLIFGFKYVMADIDEDQCILLLTKLRKAIDVIQEHGIVDFSREQKLVNRLLEESWRRRGLYPGLSNILTVILEDDSERAEQIVERMRANLSPEQDLCEEVFSMLSDREYEIPKYLQELDTAIFRLRKNLVQHTAIIDLLKKLSLFLLKKEQLRNIIRRQASSFSRDISAMEIVRNPYVLCEEYKYKPTQEDLDKEEIEDGPIDLFKIDVGMFPERYLKENPRLQDLAPGSPERLRAVIIQYLYSVGRQGHCYSALEEVYDSILANPLFYKRELLLSKDQLLSQSYLNHFKKKLTLAENEGVRFFYLNEVIRAEALIRDTVEALLRRKSHPSRIENVRSFVETQVKELEKREIKNFDRKQFVEERTKLLENVLARSFYIISGKPGTGKTRALRKIIRELATRHEEVTVLAPTGKAALRLKMECKAKNAQTIDRFIYSDRNEYWQILEDFSLIMTNGRGKPFIENLIVDESSMVDLQKLSTLFLMLRLNGAEGVKRVIMVGDENQLPPIGFGRPFYDIIQYVKNDPNYREGNFIKLLTNCRQESDPKVIEIADIFVGKNRYYNELLDEIVSTDGDISSGFAVEKWMSIDELYTKIDERLDRLIQADADKAELSKCKDKPEMINILLGLYPTGFVKGGSIEDLGIDNFQMLTPYRAEAFGCMGLSWFFKLAYPRGHWADGNFGTAFNHSDKIIRLANEYIYDLQLQRTVLRLSNGSIGVINNKQDQIGSHYRKYFFTDQEKPIYSRGHNALREDEDFELAYAITVHKSQGSDFRNVFFVLPSKRALLCKELLYTALTRSKRSIAVFLQKEESREILEYARTCSAILQRNTSIFEAPENAKEIFEPTKGVGVRSKIEYILYKAIEESGLQFEYESPLFLEKGPAKIKPDFTVNINGMTYYWEHLGELDLKEYWTKWVARRDWYKTNGKFDDLITTDDLGGVREQKILEMFEDLRRGELKVTGDDLPSKHHYELY
ncbi:MAG: ATP-dependent RecD-like DNA helicase [Candidatus Bathyarchaeota archaeon]|nr:ATP-dependent RecD-like DNA helicase [Candidatus Bathyarchaeota archaeon]